MSSYDKTNFKEDSVTKLFLVQNTMILASDIYGFGILIKNQLWHANLENNEDLINFMEYYFFLKNIETF